MKKIVLRLISASLVLLFFYTATAKLSQLPVFESELRNQNIPAWSVPYLLWLIPFLELAVVGLLLSAVSRRYGLYGSLALMAVFTLYMGLVLLQVFDRVPCSCGGVLKHMGFGVHFVFNLFFLLASLLGIWLLKSGSNQTL